MEDQANPELIYMVQVQQQHAKINKKNLPPDSHDPADTPAFLQSFALAGTFSGCSSAQVSIPRSVIWVRKQAMMVNQPRNRQAGLI